ncbi:MAG: metallophosphoesterase, partial [Nitrospinae bacterium]|nr:metallophosphoesterase [Nitrospinota bacterium]
ATGLYEIGYSNALKLGIIHHEITFDHLPVAFHGKRILFLSDLHLGGIDEIPELVCQTIQQVEVDLCIFGGDSKFSWADPIDYSLEAMQKIIKVINAPLGIYGVLGNHDSYRMVPAFKEMGLHILINDSQAIHHNGESIYLVGVDDPFYYRCHDIKKAFSQVPENEFTLFVAHTPQLFQEASSYDSSIYLCGHTHNGQVQIPRLGPIITNSRSPRKMTGGVWKYNEMIGYTSSGVGTSGARVRYFCPPEITVLTLQNKNSFS